MEIKLLALDLDGTLLQSDHATISPATAQALTDAVRQGIHVVISTGRARHRLPEALESIKGIHYAVTANGASVIDLVTERVIYAKLLSMEAALESIAILREYPLFIQLYSGGYDYVERGQMGYFAQLALSDERKKSMERGRVIIEDQQKFILAHPEGVEKFNVAYLPDAFSEEVWKRIRAVQGVDPTASFPNNIEINAAGVSKAVGLARLCDELGLTRENVMAMGDSRNDLEMIQFAGFSVAMGNADADVKTAADAVCASNDEDGVAKTIQKYLLEPTR
ncbi:MAG: Cof-type HAD-IIB family hydrolase [Pygmaiobacter sp.]